MSKLIYCAMPARMKNRMIDIMDYVTAKGLGPLHPFQALPYERYEGGPLGRERTMEICCRLINICDEFWVFGVSQGTLIETVHTQKTPEKPIRLEIEAFDPQWREFYAKLGQQFGNPLDKMLADMGLCK